MEPQVYEAELQAAATELAEVIDTASRVETRIERLAQLLLRPEAPRELRDYHNGPTAAAQSLDQVDSRLEELATQAKEGKEALSSGAKKMDKLRYALDHLYSGVRGDARQLADEEKTRQTDLFGGMRRATEAAAQQATGRPVPKRGIPWQKLRVWQGPTELAGFGRLLALKDYRDGLPICEGYRLVPPQLIVDGEVPLPEGGAFPEHDAALIDERIEEIPYADLVSWDGLDLSLQQVLRSEAVDKPQAGGPGVVRKTRRIPSPDKLSLKEILLIEGIPEATVIDIIQEDGYTVFTTERCNPPAPPKEAVPAGEDELLEQPAPAKAKKGKGGRRKGQG